MNFKEYEKKIKPIEQEIKVKKMLLFAMVEKGDSERIKEALSCFDSEIRKWESVAKCGYIDVEVEKIRNNLDQIYNSICNYK